MKEFCNCKKYEDECPEEFEENRCEKHPKTDCINMDEVAKRFELILDNDYNSDGRIKFDGKDIGSIWSYYCDGDQNADKHRWIYFRLDKTGKDYYLGDVIYDIEERLALLFTQIPE